MTTVLSPTSAVKATSSTSTRANALADRLEQGARALSEVASVLTEPEQRILVMLLDKLITNRSQFDVRGRN